jgi:hypothetical protein
LPLEVFQLLTLFLQTLIEIGRGSGACNGPEEEAERNDDGEGHS